MSAWLLAHRNALLLALRRLLAAPVNTLLALLGIGIALALPAGGYQVLAEVAGLSQGAATTPQITLFMPVAAERKAAQAVEARLKERNDTARTQLLTREDTLARMKKAEGLGDAIAALPQNPFPDALVVTPRDDSPAAMEALAGELRKWKEVEHVQVDADWARRLSAFVRLAKTALLLLASLLGIGLATITFNTIRLQLVTRHAEVEVSRLLGATDAFISRPFLWFGGLLGLLGGGVAWLIVSATVLWLRGPVSELTALYGIDFMLALPSGAQSLMLLASATLLGWLGATFSMRWHLHHLHHHD